MNRSTSQRRKFDLQEWRRHLVASVMRRWLRSTEATLRRDGTLDVSRVRRVMISRPNHRLGNALLLTPLVTELGRLLPRARVDLVVGGDDGSEVFREFANVQAVHCLSRRVLRHPLALLRMVSRLRRAHYDLTIDPCEASQSGRALLVLARAPQAIGLPRSGAHGDPGNAGLERGAPAHMAKLPVFLLRNAISGDARPDGAYPSLDIALTDKERNTARGELDARLQGAAHPRLILGVFTRATGSKRLDRDWWSRFTALVQREIADLAVVEIVPPGGASSFADRFPVYASPSVRKVAALISRLDCFVCADCGVMHLACASGTMTVGLFSTTDPARYAPYGNASRAVDVREATAEQVAADVIGAIRDRCATPVRNADPASMALPRQ